MDDISPSEFFILCLLRGDFGPDWSLQITNRAGVFAITFGGNQFKLGVAAGKTLDDALSGLVVNTAKENQPQPSARVHVLKLVGGSDRPRSIQ